MCYDNQLTRVFTREIFKTISEIVIIRNWRQRFFKEKILFYTYMHALVLVLMKKQMKEPTQKYDSHIKYSLVVM